MDLRDPNRASCSARHHPCPEAPKIKGGWCSLNALHDAFWRKPLTNSSPYLLFSNHEEHFYSHPPVSSAAYICIDSKTDR